MTGGTIDRSDRGRTDPLASARDFRFLGRPKLGSNIGRRLRKLDKGVKEARTIAGMETPARLAQMLVNPDAEALSVGLPFLKRNDGAEDVISVVITDEDNLPVIRTLSTLPEPDTAMRFTFEEKFYCIGVRGLGFSSIDDAWYTSSQTKSMGHWIKYNNALAQLWVRDAADGSTVGHVSHSPEATAKMLGTMAGGITTTVANRVHKLISSTGAYGSPTTYGSTGTGNGQYANPGPVGIVSDGALAWVCDPTNQRVQVLNAATGAWQSMLTLGGGHSWVSPMSINLRSGMLYILDSGAGKIQVFNNSNVWQYALVLGVGSTDGQISATAEGIAVTSTGQIWVSDTGNHRIQVFDSAGLFLGKVGEFGSGDFEFKFPCQCQIDDFDVFWVADRDNGRIVALTIDPGGVTPVLTWRDGGPVNVSATGNNNASASCVTGEVAVSAGFTCGAHVMPTNIDRVSANTFNFGFRNDSVNPTTCTPHVLCMEVPLFGFGGGSGGGGGGSGITQVADDTTPALGGNLFLGAFSVGDALPADLTKLSGITADVTELNYVDGVTSAIQPQITTNTSNLAAHTGNTSNPHGVTKAQVGLGSVDNTADAAKPVSTAQAAADALKANLTGATFSGDISVPTEVYGAGWSASAEAPTKGDLYTKIQTMGGGGSGDVVGPAAATDNAIVRYDLTTGKLIQNSGVTIDDSNHFVLTAASLLAWLGRSKLVSPSDGAISLTNNAGSDFGRLNIGPATGAFPAVSHSGAELQARLANDSNFTGFRGTYLAAGDATATGSANSGGIRITNAQWIASRNAGGTADVNLARINASNLIEFGTTVTATTFSGDVTVPDQAYDPTTWDANLTVPTKNAIRDKIASLVKADVGLGSVDNTSDAAKPVSTLQATAIGNVKAQEAAVTIVTDTATLPALLSGVSVVHLVVDTEAAAATDNLSAIATTGTVPDGTLLTVSIANNARVVTTKNGVLPNSLYQGNGDFILANVGEFITYVRDQGQWFEITRSSYDKGDVGLANVDNTSDAAKPVSTAQLAAITATQVHDAGTVVLAADVLTLPTLNVGATIMRVLVDTEAAAATDDLSKISPTGTFPNGTLLMISTLNSARDVNIVNTPAPIRDQIAGATNSNFLLEDVLYNIVVRRTGIAWQVVSRNPPAKFDVGLGNVDNTADTAKPVSTAQAAADALKADLTGATFTGPIIVPTDVYDATGWNGSNQVPTKDALRDKIESMIFAAGGVPPGSRLLAAPTVFAAQTTVSFNSIFNATYENYLILLSGYAQSAVAQLYLRLRAAGADTLPGSTDYSNAGIQTNSAATNTLLGPASTNFVRVSPGLTVASQAGASRIVVCRPALAAATSFMTQSTVRSGATANIDNYITSALHGLSVAYDGFTLLPVTGNISGTVHVYGYNDVP